MSSISTAPTRKLGLLRVVMGLGAVLAAAFTLAPAANAAIAGAPQVAAPGGLALSSVTIIRYDRASNIPSQARWCFTGPQNGFLNGSISNNGGTGSNKKFGSAKGFSLSGYASAQSIQPDDAYVDPNNVNCVIGEFSGTNQGQPTQARAYTVGSVDAGTVLGQGDIPNFTDTVAVGPSDATGPFGRTTGPNILVTQVDTANNQIIYTLDHDLATTGGSPNAGKFYYYNVDGTPVFGTGTPSISNNVVRVSFTVANIPAPSQVAVIGMQAGAVAAADGSNVSSNTTNTGGGELNQDESAIGPGMQTTSKPSLTGAAVVKSNGQNTNQVKFTFDKNVNLGSADCNSFQLYAVNDRTVLHGVNPSQDSNNTITCSFPNETANGGSGSGTDTSNFINQFVRAGVSDGAVEGTSPAGDSTQATAPLNPSASAPNFTSGPDITQATRGASPQNSNNVLLTFDQPIDIVGSGTVATDFQLIGTNGQSLGTATTVAPVGLNQLSVTFGGNQPNVAQSVGITMQPDQSLAFPAPPQVEQGTFPTFTNGVFGADLQDPAVEQTVGYVTGGAGQRISDVLVVHHAKKHHAKKHHAKKHHKSAKKH